MSGLRYSGTEMATLSELMANSLHRIGLRSGDIAAICCTSTVRIPLILSAIWSLNAVGSGLDIGFTAGELIDMGSFGKKGGHA
mgnify:CR=1 FL=1